MANHLRRQIREAVATRLTGLSTTGASVHQSRVYAVQDSELPCLLVFTRSESIGETTIHAPKVVSRVLTLEIVAIAKANDALDDTLDQICKEVEVALANPVTALEPLAESIGLVSTEYELSGAGEKPTGQATLLYEINYFTAENAPDVAL